MARWHQQNLGTRLPLVCPVQSGAQGRALPNYPRPLRSPLPRTLPTPQLPVRALGLSCQVWGWTGLGKWVRQLSERTAPQGHPRLPGPLRTSLEM